jgi:L-ribulokinase
MRENLVAGVDFGTDSVRVVVLDVATGRTVAESACRYERWRNGRYCDPARSQYRQHPLDYLESLESCVRSVMQRIGPSGERALRAIAFDTTGSTPCPVNRNGMPLALLEGFAENPDAMFHLWKDHTAVEEAKEIDFAFSRARMDYTAFQGTYSSEWYWAKMLRTVRADESIRRAAWTWVEHCDWIPSLLMGRTEPSQMYRGSCAAGHKALWHSRFGGLPDGECLGALDPYLVLIAQRYAGRPQPAGTRLGVVSKEWSERLGIPEDTIIGGGSLDAHAGAVGAGIRPNTLVKIVGTSSVDMIIEDAGKLAGKDLKAFCGQAEDSIVPGFVGIEASQAAFGDLFKWFVSLLLWPVREMLTESSALDEAQREERVGEAEKMILAELDRQAQGIEASDLIAVDWFNGRRYPHLNERVKGAILELDLGSTAPEIHHALVQSAAFGSKRILDSLVAKGLKIDRLILAGGIARKSPFTVQMLADVLDRPVMVCREEQVCARGAAIYAAVASGYHPDIRSTQDRFCEPYQANHFPNASRRDRIDERYRQYRACGDFIENSIGPDPCR